MGLKILPIPMSPDNYVLLIGLKILPIPMSLDNYGYLIYDEHAKTSSGILVDPADSDIVMVCTSGQ